MAANTSLRPPNHIFVDVENVKTIKTSLLEDKNLTFHLFLGPNHKTLKIDVVEPLLQHADRVQLIRSPEVGNNALDFVLVYYLGQAVASEPKAHFHIVSRDKGFDSLVKLLKSKKVSIKRHQDWGSLHFQTDSLTGMPDVATKISVKKGLSENSTMILEQLQNSPANRPKKRQTLVSHIKGYLGKDAADDMAEKIVEELKRNGHLDFDQKFKVTYYLE